MRSFKLSLLYGLIFSSCATSEKKQESTTEAQTFSSDTAKSVGAIQKYKTDTLMVDTRAAVFFHPDSLQMEKRMKEAGEENFRAGADDYIYYMNTSIEYLQGQRLPVIDAKNKKYLKFLFNNNKAQLIKLDTLPDLWGMYFFDPLKKLHYVDIIEIEDDYKEYFN